MIDETDCGKVGLDRSPPLLIFHHPLMSGCGRIERQSFGDFRQILAITWNHRGQVDTVERIHIEPLF